MQGLQACGVTDLKREGRPYTTNEFELCKSHVRTVSQSFCCGLGNLDNLAQALVPLLSHEEVQKLKPDGE